MKCAYIFKYIHYTYIYSKLGVSSSYFIDGNNRGERSPPLTPCVFNALKGPNILITHCLGRNISVVRSGSQVGDLVIWCMTECLPP